MLGLGPGALRTDAAMIGIDPEEQRTPSRRTLRSSSRSCGTTNGHEEDQPYRLVRPGRQLRPFTDFDIGVAAIASPSGPASAASTASPLSVGATARRDSTRWRCTGTS